MVGWKKLVVRVDIMKYAEEVWGIDVNDPDEFEVDDLVNISKYSFSFGFSQNFDVFNQTSKITDNSIKKLFIF